MSRISLFPQTSPDHALGSGVVLEVTAQNRPCDTIRVHHAALVEEIAGRRGIAAIVISTGTVHPNDVCRVVQSNAEADATVAR